MRATRLYTSLCRSIRRSVGPSVTLYFFLFFCVLWPHRICPNDDVTSIKAPAHPNATGVAVYSAFFFFKTRGFHGKLSICFRRILAFNITAAIIGSLTPLFLTLDMIPYDWSDAILPSNLGTLIHQGQRSGLCIVAKDSPNQN